METDSPDEVIVTPLTMKELLDRVEGLRGQLSTFSDSALAEISMLKRFIVHILDEEPQTVIKLLKLSQRT
jgi:hypothetical protein